jgi:CheY-like chemotaxis protein
MKISNSTERLLVVDDEKNIRAVLKEGLEAHAYNVQEAASAEDALRLIERQSFDLVLLDLRMPGMDGLELLTRIHERSPQTIIIAKVHTIISPNLPAFPRLSKVLNVVWSKNAKRRGVIRSSANSNRHLPTSNAKHSPRKPPSI